ncbi:MAG: ubiquitin family protein, partial [Aigarchaeota archaeon]|nr:ubiquitin family protein [Aigarchaeota archaeon]
MRVRIVPAVVGGPPLEIDVPSNTTVGAIKLRVCAMKKLRPDDAKLTYKGRALGDT